MNELKTEHQKLKEINEDKHWIPEYDSEGNHIGDVANPDNPPVIDLKKLREEKTNK